MRLDGRGGIVESIMIRLRANRTKRLIAILSTFSNQPIQILDVGGHPKFWESADFTGDANCQITLINTETVNAKEYPYMQAIQGDGRDMKMFSDGEFEMVVSNSVIEHVGIHTDMIRFANEIQRVSQRYFVQTPYYWFPIDPHYGIPFFQFVPIQMKALIIKYLTPDGKGLDYESCLNAAEGYTMLTKTQFKNLFPKAHIIQEKVWGITYSLIAIGGGEK